MANVSKIVEIIFGANPTDADLREIVRRVEAKLPQDDGSVTLTLDKLDAFEQRIYQRVAQAMADGREQREYTISTPEYEVSGPITEAEKAPRSTKSK